MLLSHYSDINNSGFYAFLFSSFKPWQLKKCYISILTSKQKDTNIKHSHDEVRYDAYTVSFPVFWFSGCPVQSIQDVLSK